MKIKEKRERKGKRKGRQRPIKSLYATRTINGW